MPNPDPRGPRPLSDVLGELFALRGFGRLHGMLALQTAWDAAVGEAHRGRTRLGEVRRNVLTVTVDHPALLEELSAYRKHELLHTLRDACPDARIDDLRYRIGRVDD